MNNAAATPVRISVAMATYNGERFLPEQLDSLALQKHLPYELVACDDGSTDDTVSILQEFSRHAPFPVHIHQNEVNLGYSDNFLNAASLCESDWIAFCDQDDIWLPEKLSRVASAIAEEPYTLLVAHSAKAIDAEGKDSGVLLPHLKRDRVFCAGSRNPFSVRLGFTCCFKRQLVTNFPYARRPFNSHGERQAHDRYVFHLSNCLGKSVDIADALALYRRHEHTVTGMGSLEVSSTTRCQKLMKKLSISESELGLNHQLAKTHKLFYDELAREVEHLEIPVEWKRQLKAAPCFFECLAECYGRRKKICDYEQPWRKRFSAFIRCGFSNTYGNLPGGAFRSVVGFGRDATSLIRRR